MTNSDIAEWLSISLKTVHNHVTNICNKLQVANRTQAVLRARESGLRNKKKPAWVSFLAGFFEQGIISGSINKRPNYLLVLE
jgi:hypothetical protein